MLYVCLILRGVMNVVFSLCIVTRGTVGRKYEYFVMEMLYVYALCLSCMTCSLFMLVENIRGVYVDLKYDEISLTLTAGSVSIVMWSSLVCL